MYLIKAYPNVLVASLQAFNPQKAGSAKYINKRQAILSKFLRGLLRNKILRSDPYMENFLL